MKAFFLSLFCLKSGSGRTMRVATLTLAVALAPLAVSAAAQSPEQPDEQPAPASNPAPSAKPANPRFAAVDALMQEAVQAGTIPGGVLIVGHHGRIVHRRAYGWRSLEPTREPMTTDTVFDLASLTKCLATATAVTQLLEEGKLRLSDPVAKYLPEFAANGKGEITIRQLLTHYSGLREDLDLKSSWTGREQAFRLAMAERPINPPGSHFLYSDINFITLGFLVERLSGMTLDEYATKFIYHPLGMRETRFLPPADWRARIAPTERDEQGHMLRGAVHDPTARRMGGVAGHAGLFSTADDMALFAQEMLDGHRILSPLAVEKMTSPAQPPTGTVLRGLGWDLDSPFSTNRGELLPVGSFGHTGFTGTSLWIDPASQSFIVLLTNSVHPHGHRAAIVSLRTRVATAVAASLALEPDEEVRLRMARLTGYNEALTGMRLLPSRNGVVKNGIDVLEEHRFAELKAAARPTSQSEPDPDGEPIGHHPAARPLRLALVTNQSGLDLSERRTIDILAHAPGFELKAILTPEHGLGDGLTSGGNIDAATGIAVHSVYGEAADKRRPSLELLRSVDAVVFDLADLGVRYYTYETTLGYFLEAAAQAGRPIVVLDRPNPLTGSFIQGPLSDAGRESFTDYQPLPLRHGMTLGELARYFNAERKIGARLTVVPMSGWQRGDWFDSTGQLWVNPSPNIRSLTAATLYPGLGWLEFTNLSVGRGTDSPFELFGAPWIDARPLAAALNARQLTGIRFVPTSFTPASDTYAHRLCHGVGLVVTDRNALDAPELGLEIASALLRLHPADFETKNLDRLLVNRASVEALRSGADPRRIAEQWQEQREHFQPLRAKFLLY